MIFIRGHREISDQRILDLVKNYIKRDTITWGVFEEEFIEGFEGQPQFKTAKFENINALISKIKSKLKLPNEIEILKYSQKDNEKILEQLDLQKIVLINGSWKIAFHRRKEFEILSKKNVSISFKSPFHDENEAQEKSESLESIILNFQSKLIEELKKQRKKLSEEDYFLEYANIVSKQSFDYTWQTGAVLVKDEEVIATGHNRILPYETFAMHHGSSREKNKSNFNDLNNYDTIHAEMDLLMNCLKNSISVQDCSLYIDLMPCPNCARAIARSGIKKVIYRKSHSGDFGEMLLKNSGVNVKKATGFVA